MLQHFAIWLLMALLAGAAAMDLLRLRIPNYFPVAIVILFFAWVALSASHSGIWQNAVLFGFTLFGGMVLFSRGWLGGGDVKLLAAIALWFDFAGAASLFFYVSIGGLLLSLIFVILRRMLPARLTINATAPALKRNGPIPYGIAISGGAALAILGGGIHPAPSRPAYAGIHASSLEPAAGSPSARFSRHSPELLPPASG